MEKEGLNKRKFSTDILMADYDEWLRKDGNLKRKKNSEVTEDVINSYKGFTVFFKRDSFGGKLLTNQEKHFVELLPKLLGINKFNGTYSNRKGDRESFKTGIDIITNIIVGIKKELFQNNKLTKTEKNHRSYANKFFEFLQNEYLSKSDKRKEWNYPSLSAGDLAVLSGIKGEIYLHNTLRTKFKSRLRCQDRTSGDKIWLPLRFIGKIYSEAKKEDKVNLFSKWLDTLVDGIYVHYQNEDKVKTISFKDEGVSLLLRDKDNKTEEFEVRVITSHGQYPVLTPTGKGNQKVLMKVKSISDIAIDHVISIDRILRDLSEEGKLPRLTIVSNKYKEIQMEEEPNEGEAVKELVGGKKKKINLKYLIDELETIRDAGLLRLMSSKYNSKKSNGDTFEKIVEDKGSYYGILETGIVNDNDHARKYVLYQNLKEENGVTRTTSVDTIPVDILPALDKEELKTIIDYI